MKTTAPKYIIDIMDRARYATGYGDPGYTIEIRKATPYTTVNTLRKEVERLVAYAEREWTKKLKANGWREGDEKEPIAFIQEVPSKTHHRYQYAKVTIFDPVMLDLDEWMQ